MNYKSSVLSASISFLSFLYLPKRIYANGAEMKIDEYDPKMIPIQMVKAKCWITPVHKRNIATTTRNTANTVPNDLLMVCRRLSSNIFPNKTPLLPHLFWIFSLILSKMMIVSLMLYPIFAKRAMIKTLSIITVLSNRIRIPYMPAGNDTSKIMVPTVTAASTLGATNFLMEAKEKSI